MSLKKKIPELDNCIIFHINVESKNLELAYYTKDS